jgi:cell division protein FtsX
MHTTYHLNSAQELTTDILEAIKLAYQSKPIVITIEEDQVEMELEDTIEHVLADRMQEDEGTYLTAEESLKKLQKKYGL